MHIHYLGVRALFTSFLIYDSYLFEQSLIESICDGSNFVEINAVSDQEPFEHLDHGYLYINFPITTKFGIYIFWSLLLRLLLLFTLTELFEKNCLTHHHLNLNWRIVCMILFSFVLHRCYVCCVVWYGMVWHGSALHTWSECIRAALSSFTRTSLAHTQTYTSHMCWINNSFFTLTPRTHQRYGIIIGAFTIHSIHFLAAPSYDREIYESLGGETIKYW